MEVGLLLVGNELLDGRVSDLNGPYLGRRLEESGHRLAGVMLVPDSEQGIAHGLSSLLRQYRLVVVSGGIGPTEDDVTASGAALALGRPLRPHAELLAALEGYWKRRGKQVTRSMSHLAELPEGAELIGNPVGMAAGFKMSVGPATLYFLPGVPEEFTTMVEQSLLPAMPVDGRQYTAVRTLRCFGKPESRIAELLAPMEGRQQLHIGYYPRFPEVHVRLKVRCVDQPRAREILDEAIIEASGLLGRCAYGEEDETLPAVLGRELSRRGLTLALAESCTGGLIAHMITEVPGSSDYLKHGLVVYSNQAKVDLLGVKPGSIESFGAVSRQVVLEMLEGLLARAGADVGLAVSGIAGPGGGSPEKPVGTVHLAAGRVGAAPLHRKILAHGDRSRVKTLAAFVAIDMLRECCQITE